MVGPGASQMHLPGRVTACECGLGSLVTGNRSLAGSPRYRAVVSDPLGISPPLMQDSPTICSRATTRMRNLVLGHRGVVTCNDWCARVGMDFLDDWEDRCRLVGALSGAETFSHCRNRERALALTHRSVQFSMCPQRQGTSP